MALYYARLIQPRRLFLAFSNWKIASRQPLVSATSCAPCLCRSRTISSGSGLRGEERQSELRAAQDQLDAAQAQLKAVTKDLRSEQKQMDRLRSSTSRKLILPFGKSQRKLQQLTASRREDD